MTELAVRVLDFARGNAAMDVSATAGWIGLIWYITVQVVCALGYYQM